MKIKYNPKSFSVSCNKTVIKELSTFCDPNSHYVVVNDKESLLVQYSKHWLFLLASCPTAVLQKDSRGR